MTEYGIKIQDISQTPELVYSFQDIDKHTGPYDVNTKPEKKKPMDNREESEKIIRLLKSELTECECELFVKSMADRLNMTYYMGAMVGIIIVAAVLAYFGMSILALSITSIALLVVPLFWDDKLDPIVVAYIDAVKSNDTEAAELFEKHVKSKYE